VYGKECAKSPREQERTPAAKS